MPNHNSEFQGDKLELIATPNDAGRRLDRILRKSLLDLPLSRIHRLLRTGQVMLNGKPAQGEIRVQAGAVITIPASRAQDFKGSHRIQKEVSLEGGSIISSLILWEGSGLLMVNKPPGILVHGLNSLETRVYAHLAGRLLPSLSFRPGPLHRLDRQTSGIITFSTSLEGARCFSALIQEGQVKKRYLALVDGNLETPVIWEDMLIRDRDTKKTFIVGKNQTGSQKAETRIFPLAVSSFHSLIMAEISTGRTHQIRAQAAFHGYPLSWDKKYGGSPQHRGDSLSRRFLLHAYTLEFPRDNAGIQRMNLPSTLKAPLPDRFYQIICEIFGEKCIHTRISM